MIVRLLPARSIDPPAVIRTAFAVAGPASTVAVPRLTLLVAVPKLAA